MNDSEAPMVVTRERRVTMPLILLIGLLMVVSAGAVALNTTREQVARNTTDIKEIQTEQKASREILIRIDENVKTLKQTRP